MNVETLRTSICLLFRRDIINGCGRSRKTAELWFRNALTLSRNAHRRSAIGRHDQISEKVPVIIVHDASHAAYMYDRPSFP